MKYFAIVILSFVFTIAAVGLSQAEIESGDLYVGWAKADITPSGPVALSGQMHLRIAKKVRDPVTATVLALETRDKSGKTIDQAICVSCDLVLIPRVMLLELRKKLEGKLNGFDLDKLLLNATHTHTGPIVSLASLKGRYDLSGHDEIIKPDDYQAILVDRLATAVEKAWKDRGRGAYSWALGQAVVGFNRRATYFDGHAQMYGRSNGPEFKGYEGDEDHGLLLLFFFDENQKLTGMVVNLACPSQETESLSEISADFWHEVRQEIAKRYGADVAILPQCSAAGDLSPHVQWRKAAEHQMSDRKGFTRREEIAERIADGIDQVFEASKKSIRTQAVFAHQNRSVELPTQKEDPANPFSRLYDSVNPAEIHLLRLDDVTMATNPFELYLEYGIRIKARSPSTATFLIQLSCGSDGYLPTVEAVRGGGYSAERNYVGPEGGQILVEETLKGLNEFYKKP
jgi:hypothetical protein